jgi:thiamine biosynthesis lipoprotein
MGGTGRMPEPAQVEEARARVGMARVELNPQNFTVRFACPGMMLDLGAIGKGAALETAADLLREAGVTSALLHGGTSTIYALGHPPRADHWSVALEYPQITGADSPRQKLGSVHLRDESLSVSAVWGRSFKAGEKTFGHVLDPRTGQPVVGALLAAVVLPSATETDALSTALLVAGETGHDQIAALRPQMRTLILIESPTAPGTYRISGRSITLWD